MNISQLLIPSLPPACVRQPVVDRSQEVVGYKVLCKGGTGNLLGRIEKTPAMTVRIDAPELPTEAAPSSAFTYDLQKLTKGKKSFVNFEKPLLIEQAFLSLDPTTSVVEVTETDHHDVEFINACLGVRKAGYTIALNDYVIESQHQPLLEHIDMMDVDFPTVTADHHERIIETAMRYGFAPVACEVDTQDDFAKAQEFGYQYFRGSYYSKPRRKIANRLLGSHLIYLQLLEAVNASLFQMDDIEQLIRKDVALTTQLLRYLNSPAFGLRTRVSSIRHALGVLGHRPLKKWLSLIAVSELSKEKPLVLMTTSLIRARFCETLGEKLIGPNSVGDCFLVGLLSLLDAILDQPLGEVVAGLGLSASIEATLLHQNSPFSPLRDLIQAIEEGDWRWISALAFQLQFNEAQIFAAYEDAIQWASSITSSTR